MKYFKIWVPVGILLMTLASCTSLAGVRDDLAFRTDRFGQNTTLVVDGAQELLMALATGSVTKEEFIPRMQSLLRNFGDYLTQELAGIKETLKELPDNAVDEIKGNTGNAITDFLGSLTSGESLLGAGTTFLLTLFGVRKVQSRRREQDVQYATIAERIAKHETTELAKSRNESRLELLERMGMMKAADADG